MKSVSGVDHDLCSQVFPQGMEVKLYAPPAPQFNISVIILFLIAVFTVTLGGFWSGAAERSVSDITGHSSHRLLNLMSYRKLMFSEEMMSTWHLNDLREKK